MLVVALSGLALGACERDSQAKKAINEATVAMHSLDASYGSSAAPNRRQSVYAGVISTLNSAASSDVPAYASSANLMLAEAHSGLAAPLTSTAGQLEAEALNRARILRADLSQWLELSAMAQAASIYDPSPEIAALEAQITEIQSAVRGLTQARVTTDTRHKQLVSEADALKAQASVIRDEIGELRIRSTTVSATEAATISEEIRERSRTADSLEMQAGKIMVDADPLVPTIQGIDVSIAGLNSQIESLRAAQEGAARRGRDAKTDAAEASALASVAAENLDKAANDLVSLREGDLARTYDDALRSLTSSLNSARKAASDNRNAGKLAEGTAHHQIGDLHWQRAHGFREFSVIMDALATATPTLPRAGAYEGHAKAAADARTEALTLAAESYEQARAALGASGGRGDSAARIERISRTLDLSIAALRGENVDWSAASRPAPSDEFADESMGEDVAAGSDAPNLGTTLQGWIDTAASGDFSFLSSAIYTDIPAIQNATGSIGRLINASQRLDQLCTEKFGQSLTDFTAQQGQDANPLAALGAGGLPDVDDISVDDFDIRVSGDTAEVLPIDDPSGTPIRFRLVNNAWKLDLSRSALPPEFAAAEPMLDQLLGLLPRMADAMESLARETENDIYRSTQAVYIASQQKMMPIMLEIMGSMQPPGGG